MVRCRQMLLYHEGARANSALRKLLMALSGDGLDLDARDVAVGVQLGQTPCQGLYFVRGSLEVQPQRPVCALAHPAHDACMTSALHHGGGEMSVAKIATH